MKARSNYMVLGLSLLALVLAGCGESKPSVPATPDGMVKAVAHGMANNNPAVAWAAMPPKWQQDVDSLVKTFAEKVDAEVYDKTFAVAGKTSAMLKKQKPLITELMKDDQMAGAMPVDAKQVEANYDTVLRMITHITDSKAAKLSTLKTMDVGQFLGTTGSAMMKDVSTLMELTPNAVEYRKTMKDLRNIKVEVIEQTDTSAKLRVTLGAEVKEEAMTKVDGKWVPAEMAAEWDQKIAEARAGLAELSGEEMAARKPAIMALLNTIDSGVNAMNNATTKEELQMAAMGLVGMVMQQMTNM